jgi:hypothetical protein
MANLPLKPYSQAPMVDDGNMRDFLTWVHVSLNQLIGAANATPQQGLQTLVNKQIDPTTTQIVSAGSRMGSIVSRVTFTVTTTTATFFWDSTGPTGSGPLTIYRDDGTVIGPTIVGSPLVVTGLTPSTKYFFYLYWDEAAARVAFAVGNSTGVGTPPIAFTAQNLVASQQLLLAGRIPIALALAATGITTTGAGSASGSGGGGGGGVGGHIGGTFT